ncbi:MAG: hypothetical protein WCO58_02635 [bacterium]
MKNISKVLLSFLFIAITANIKLPYVEYLAKNTPFTEMYLYFLLGSCAVLSFVFLVYPDPGDGTVGGTVADFSPRGRAVVITLIVFSFCLFFAYGRNELRIDWETTTILVLLSGLYYNALTSMYYLFARKTDNVWSNSNFRVEEYTHRGKRNRRETISTENPAQ